MAVPVPSRRRSRNNFESDGSSDALGTPEAEDSTRKRPRISNGTTVTTALNGDASTNGCRSPSSSLQREVLQPSLSRRKHQPGSIVRVKLNNFVTYTAVEFFPGPGLNMVIGPNGTGKSTLVCAICLGLGWPTSTLGRAKEIGEFVKHGAKEATIEIELANDGKKHSKNVVIGCHIKKDGNKSEFSINGVKKGKKVVLETVRSMSIQIDNLCQFLPQDKVVEFAAMTPVELLRSTQRAVASNEMIKTHEDLKELRRNQKALQDNINSEQETLDNLEGRQRLQEADVERMREREQIVERVRLLEMARPSVHYREAKEKYLEAKEAKKSKQQEYNELQAEVEPALRAMNAKERYRKSVDAVVHLRREAIVPAEQTADAVERAFQSLQEKHSNLEDAKAAEKNAMKEKKQAHLKLDGRLRELRIQLQHVPPEVDFAAYNEKMRAKQRAMDEAGSIINSQKGRQDELNKRGQANSGQISDAKRSLEQLDSQTGKQNSKLQKLSPDTAKMWQWIQEHPEEFEKPVFGPPLVECSVKDPKCVDQIESLFQKSAYLSFTVQTRKDAAILSNVAHDRLHLSDINFRTMFGGLDQFRSPALSEEDMATYGFEGWAIDLMNGPEPVLAMLCYEIKLHETGIAVRDTTPQQFHALQQSNISNWITNKFTYRISRRREYGPDATSTQTRSIRKGQFWTDQPVNQEAKQAIQNKINDLQEEIAGFKREVAEAQQVIEDQRQVIRENQDEHKRLQQAKLEQQKAMSEFKGLPTKISTAESKLESLAQDLAGYTDRLREQSRKQDEIAMERACTALKHADAVEKLQSSHDALHEAELMLIEATSDFTILADRNKEVQTLLDSKKKELAQLEEQRALMHRKAERYLKELQELLRADEGDILRDFLQGLPKNQTAEELESEIEAEKARLELMHEGNGNTIREFENRRQRIEKLKDTISRSKAALDELDSEIGRLKAQWEPKLDGLVKRISESFSHNMEQISCAGEVGIHKDEDFDQWAIEIRVKFRESEPLTILNSHRQSGGERAVSTIFYLMSLQSLTPSPFRVVDEINQGMDPRNERLVHKRMVDIACGIADNARDPSFHDHDLNHSDHDEDEVEHAEGRGGSKACRGGSQYFLITPKLLHDLSYARGMQVMCIASGEYMPEKAQTVDFKACVNIMKGKKGLDGSSMNGLADRSINGGMDEMGRAGRLGIAAG